jgi:hypothetical protein
MNSISATARKLFTFWLIWSVWTIWFAAAGFGLIIEIIIDPVYLRRHCVKK